MSTVTVYTAERMQAIEDAAIVGGHISTDNLILEAHDGSTIDAGSVRGPQGDQGDPGEVTEAELLAYLPKYDNSTDLVADTTSVAALIKLNSTYGWVLARKQTGTWVATLGPIGYSDTTDENGAIQLSAGTFGFDSFVAAQADIDWGTDLDSAQIAQAKLGGGYIQIRAFLIFSDQTTAFGAIIPLADTAITGSVTMTGKWT